MDQKNKKTLLALLPILFLTACGSQSAHEGFTLLPGEGQNGTISVETDRNMEADGAQEEGGDTAFVYICGEVASPGVYEVPGESRIWDVLLLAGGFTSDAAEESINLAEKVEDGMQITVPSAAQEEARRLREEAEASGRINLNTATREQLCTIPGIGESRAEAILRYREARGGFSDAEEIMQVDGIKEGLYAKIQDKIYVE